MSTFDSKEFQFKDIQVFAAGQNIATLMEIKYSSKREKTFFYARGDKPRSIQNGNLDFSGNLKIAQSELRKLLLVSPNQDPTLLCISVVIAYAPELGSKREVDTLIGVEFTEWNKGMAQGDGMAEIELPFMFLDVKTV